VNKKATLKEALQRRRQEFFCGRDQELERLDGYLAVPPPRVLYLYGPGGVGKTLLLQHWLHSHNVKQPRLYWLNAKSVACEAGAIRKAFDHLSLAPAARNLVVLDDFQHWAPLETWLRNDILSALPEKTHLVIASREQPSLDWVRDSGWEGITDFLCLEPLDEAACLALLQRLQVSGDQHRKLLRLGAGNPLGLTLAASLIRAQKNPEDIAWLRSFVSDLTAVLDPPPLDSTRWEALECCTLAGFLDEPILRAVGHNESAAESVAWLRRQGFATITEDGLTLRSFVRNVVVLRSYFENPRRMLGIAEHCAREQLIRAASCDAEQWLEVFARITQACDTLRLTQDPIRMLLGGTSPPWRLQPCNRQAAEPLLDAERLQGHLQTWVDKRAPALFSLDDGDKSQFAVAAGDPAAISAPGLRKVLAAFGIRLEEEPSELVAALPPARKLREPGIARNWLVLAALARHLCKTEPGTTLLLMPVELGFDAAPRIPYLQVRDARQPASNDWQAILIGTEAQTPEHALALMNALQGNPLKSAGTAAAGKKQLERPVFKRAVLDALRHFTDARHLGNNPVMGSTLLTNTQPDVPEPGDDVFELREFIKDTIRRIGEAPNNQKFQQVLEAVYLSPRRQKTAAAELNMAYSSFRRHLYNAREMLAEELWQMELKARNGNGR
jgi:hypothetical protein